MNTCVPRTSDNKNRIWPVLQWISQGGSVKRSFFVVLCGLLYARHVRGPNDKIMAPSKSARFYIP
jgi:hypothetical protein